MLSGLRASVIPSTMHSHGTLDNSCSHYALVIPRAADVSSFWPILFAMALMRRLNVSDAPERITYATERNRNEALRLDGVLDRRLAPAPYVAGDSYPVAEMASLPWGQTWKVQQIPLADFPAVSEWYGRLKDRPALRKGMAFRRQHAFRS